MAGFDREISPEISVLDIGAVGLIDLKGSLWDICLIDERYSDSIREWTDRNHFKAQLISQNILELYDFHAQPDFMIWNFCQRRPRASEIANILNDPTPSELLI